MSKESVRREQSKAVQLIGAALADLDSIHNEAFENAPGPKGEIAEASSSLQRVRFWLAKQLGGE